LKGKGQKYFLPFLEGSTEQMDKNSFPIFPPHQGFAIEPLFVKGEVEDVGKKIDQVLFKEENPDPLPLQILGPMSEERFYRLIGVQNFGMGIRDHKGRLNRIEKKLSIPQNINHLRLRSILLKVPPSGKSPGIRIR
jgi:hypothetical protein